MKEKTYVSKLSLGLSLLLSCGMASAEVWSDLTTISKLYPYASGGYAFNTPYANSTFSSCDYGTRWILLATQENYKAQVASLLLAFAAGKPIRMAIEELPASCEGRVNRFMVYP